MSEIILPSRTPEGKPKISYSQVTSWEEDKSFDPILAPDGKLKPILGRDMYILKKFMRMATPEHPMQIYAPFGTRIEDAICLKNYAGFDKKEIEVLKSVEPVGCFQQEINIDFGDFVLNGFIDDGSEDRTHLRDYKSCSQNTAKKYSKPDYYQLDVYALDEYKRSGLVPSIMEIILIERGGSHFSPPLKVNSILPPIYRSTSPERLALVEERIIRVVKEISDHYKVYLALNK